MKVKIRREDHLPYIMRDLDRNFIRRFATEEEAISYAKNNCYNVITDTGMTNGGRFYEYNKTCHHIKIPINERELLGTGLNVTLDSKDLKSMLDKIESNEGC